MRVHTLLALSCAAIALSACGTSSTEKAAAPATQVTKDVTPAVSASAQEQKEMAAIMGGAPADAADDIPAVPALPVEAVDSASTTTTATTTTTTTATDVATETATGTADVPVTAMAAADRPADVRPAPTPVAGAPTECPGVEVLPDTKSITYFDDPEGKPSGKLVARASLVDIKGGCDYAADSVVVDIDMIMQGRIADAGRYEGRKDLEAFMTFPYFVAVMDPQGRMVDKKILATAMRFKPEIDDLSHAEKITQTIPLPDIAQGPNYTITVGFQLNRAQLDYNRGGAAPAPKPAHAQPGARKEPVKEPARNTDAKKVEKPAGTVSPPAAAMKAVAPKADEAPETDATPPQAPAAEESAGAKMTPIVE